MINFLDTEKDYNEATTELRQILQKEIDIIDNPFNKEFTIFIAFEFDRIYGNNFYNSLINFLNNRGSESFTFYTLVPDPVSYFFFHFKKYSIGKLPSNTSADDYLDFLIKDPGNPADGLAYNAETITIYSNEPTWAIIGSKDLEIGIVGFVNEKIRNEFTSCFDNDVFISIKTRLNDLDEMLNLHKDTLEIHSRIIKSYAR